MRIRLVSLALIGLAACTAQDATGPNRRSISAATSAKAKPPANPTASWKIPLADAGLAFRSDHASSDGTYSVYSDGQCAVATVIFLDGSGDATLNTAKGGCQRKFTLAYPDGSSEVVPSFLNLNQLENASFSITSGQAVERRFVVNPGTFTRNSRCDRLDFGVYEREPSLGAGSDSVLVQRIDARTWHVFSKPDDPDGTPHNLALCEKTGELLRMPVDFVVVASRDLP